MLIVMRIPFLHHHLSIYRINHLPTIFQLLPLKSCGKKTGWVTIRIRIPFMISTTVQVVSQAARSTAVQIMHLPWMAQLPIICHYALPACSSHLFMYTEYQAAIHGMMIACAFSSASRSYKSELQEFGWYRKVYTALRQFAPGGHLSMIVRPTIKQPSRLYNYPR